ncbi:MAG: hypothetical protein AAGA96_02780 [Verrucomicrobiota bacterium]
MNDRYPISGIRQSYRHTRETRTVVMPLMIVALGTAMGVFYFQTMPEQQKAASQVVDAEQEVLETEPSMEKASVETAERSFNASVSQPAIANSSPAPSTTNAQISTDLLQPLPITSATLEPILIASRSADTEFTQWMSPLALDTYIRQLNGGHETSFWKRGHWITSVEGRWNGSSHEFRIVFKPIPDLERWQWQYRANQTGDAFLETHTELAKLGYTLIQSQSFERPDGSPRYQGVWHKEMATAPMADLENPPTDLLPKPRPLDVNRLEFR